MSETASDATPAPCRSVITTILALIWFMIRGGDSDRSPDSIEHHGG